MFDFVLKRKTSLAWALVGLSALAFIGLGFELFLQQLGVLAWKVLLVGLATLIAHGARRQLFHYVDLSEMLRAENANAGRVLIALCIFYAAIIFSLCSGL